MRSDIFRPWGGGGGLRQIKVRFSDLQKVNYPIHISYKFVISSGGQKLFFSRADLRVRVFTVLKFGTRTGTGTGTSTLVPIFGTESVL
jgi:hypothetical protein